MARAGRLAVISDGRRPTETRFVVLPDDGSESIDLRVNRAVVESRVGEASVATIRCFLASLELSDFEGTRIDAQPEGGTPVVYPHVVVTGPDGERYGDVRASEWRFLADGSLPLITLDRVDA